jgi:hypothetical protein
MTPDTPVARAVRAATTALAIAAIATPLPARGQSVADPLSGVWTGYIGESPATPMAVRIELTLGPGGALAGSVTGPRLTPGEIRSGSFDPLTGALSFTVAIHSTMSDQGGAVRFDGRVVRDTVSGNLTLGTQRGVFLVVREQPNAKRPPRGGPTDAAAASVRRSFVQVSDWITRAADLVPAERYAYRPIGTARTFGQVVGHVVDGARYHCGRAAGRNIEWSDATEKTVTVKAALTRALRQVVAECMIVYDGAGPIAPLTENLAHVSLHYGNLVTYLRMLGLVPPSS